MPFVLQDDRNGGTAFDAALATYVPPAQIRDEGPGVIETAKAAFSQHNLIASWFQDTSPIGELDPEFNPFAVRDPTRPWDRQNNPFVHIGGYEEHLNSFTHARNANDLERIRQQIDRENENKNTLAEAGWGGIAASIAAGVLDPTIFLPGGAVVKGARGVKILATAGRFAAAGAASVAVQEALLHTTQEARTVEESRDAVAAGAVLSGIFGVIASGFSKAKLNRTTRQLDSYLHPKPGDVDITAPGATPRKAVEDIWGDLSDPHSIERAEKVLGEAYFRATSPRLSNAVSEAEPTVAISDLLHQWVMPKAEGVKRLDAETSTRLRVAEADVAIGKVEDLYVNYQTGGTKKRAGFLSRVTQRFGSAEGKVSFEKFNEETAKALRRTREEYIGEGGIQEAWEAAVILRREVFDPTARELVSRGYFTKQLIEENPNYFYRMYDKVKLSDSGEAKEFVDAIIGHQSAKALVNGVPYDRAAARSELNAVVSRMLETAGDHPGDLPYRGPLLARTLDVPDVIIEPWLVSDAVRVTKYYSRAASSDLEIGKRFGIMKVLSKADETLPEDVAAIRVDKTIASVALRDRDNRLYQEFLPSKKLQARLDARKRLARNIYEAKTDADAQAILREADVQLAKEFSGGDMPLAIERIEDWYDTAIENAKGDAKAQSKLRRAKERDLRNIRTMRDEIRGTLGIPRDPGALAPEILRNGRQLAYLSVSGKIAMSSMTDLAMPVMNYGIGNVFRYAVVPMLRSFKSNVAKMAKDEIRLAIGAADTITNARAKSINGLANEVVATGSHGRFGNALDKATHYYSLANLIGPWNAIMENYAVMVAQGFIISNARKVAAGKALSPKTLKRLRELGLGVDHLRRAGAQFEQHGHVVDGVREPLVPNTSAWTDLDIRERYRGALNRARDLNILRGSAGDRPNIPWMSHEVQASIFQFMNFSFAANTRILARGLVYRDAAIASGVLASTAFGMMAVAMKRAADGRDLPDPGTAKGLSQWTFDGFKQAGLSGIFFDIDEVVSAATSGHVGVTPALGLGKRYYSGNDMLDAVLGPTASLAGDAAISSARLVTGKFNDGDLRSFRRMIPMQNHFLLSRIFSQLEDTTSSALGLK